MIIENVKENEYCNVTVVVKAEKNDISNKMDQVLKTFENAPVKGFRQGVKAPISAIRMQYPREINQSLKHLLLEEAYHRSLFHLGVDAYGVPTIDHVNCELNEFDCVLSFKHRPKVDVTEWKDFTFSQPQIQNPHPRIKHVQSEFVIQNSDLVDFNGEDTVGLFDEVVLSVNGEEQTHSVGSSDFDDQLVNMLVGEEKTFVSSCDNIETDFTIKIVSAKHRELKADVLENYKMTKEQLLNEIQKTVLTQVHDEMVEEVKKLIINKLLELYPIEIPTFMIDKEVDFICVQNNLKRDLLSEDDLNKLKEAAKANMNMELILSEARKVDQSLRVSRETASEIMKFHLEALYKKIGGDPKTLLKRIGKEYLEFIQDRVTNEYSLDQIAKTIKLI